MTVPELIDTELRRQGVATTDLLLCAVSGGGDSAALAVALHAAGYQRLHLGWINHNLRSRGEMARDAAVVHALGADLKAPVLDAEVPEGHIRSQARALGQSIEQVARRLRYEALRHIATRIASGGPSCDTSGA
ncbi:MAG: ATP-binding protein, partial [Alkalispirochaeta sp.]